MTTVGAFPNYDDLDDHVNRSAPAVRRLAEITTCAGDDLHLVWHLVWVDQDGGEVRHGRTEEPVGSPWTLDREPAAEALPWVTELLAFVLDAVQLAQPPGSTSTV